MATSGQSTDDDNDEDTATSNKPLLGKMYQGIVTRTFGTSTYEPETARARRAGICPRCGEEAAKSTHKSGWCSKCQKNDSLFDFSEGF
ncbi:hypothetical protein CYMTET_15467 [Cymbomonas tetramitiformis]|uniref:Uncharacterized protein n=1 Tax=Cymbomonas tetramitiformis TaxID=36881 RepID=A0AAE0GDZ6_9CHLO|nr:hypothetical protein CYMTET_50468 [Cymbomonas tetramitiformis]KAK3276449.1 hypothetical protein CYMTET_15467 [Cymbomonas tetramitiformis]